MNFKYDRDIYLKSFDDGEIIYYETFLPLENETISLLFPIEEVIAVTNYGLDIIYEQDKDYVVRDGKLVILPNGNIPVLKLDEYYRKEPDQFPAKIIDKYCPYKFNEDRYLMFGESDTMTKHQFTITYKHKAGKPIFELENQKDKLKRFFTKLEQNKGATVVFFGDSITVGCNSSGTEYGNNTLPHAEPWPVMVTKHLEDIYSVKINYINTAVGGMITEWGRDNYEERVNAYHPDLLFLAFGMNDGILEKEKHIALIKEIIDGVRNKNPECDFVLISTTIPNNESWTYDGNQKTYYEEYQKIDDPHIAFVNMTKVHLELLKRKRFKDMTGNNVNHPNDFLARVYAQAILKVMGVK